MKDARARLQSCVDTEKGVDPFVYLGAAVLAQALDDAHTFEREGWREQSASPRQTISLRRERGEYLSTFFDSPLFDLIAAALDCDPHVLRCRLPHL